MENWIDSHRAEPLDDRALWPLLLAASAAAENYSALARCFGGWQAEALQAMAREARAQGACLGGICALVTGEPPRHCAPSPDGGALNVRLKKAYSRAMHLLAACEERSADAEYGPVFHRLAARQQEHCRKILEIIGSL